MIEKCIAPLFGLFCLLEVSGAAAADARHVHPLLNCFDSWGIADFDSRLHEPALFAGQSFSEMKVTMNLDNPALHGWVRQVDKDRSKALLFGCLEVEVSRSGVEKESVGWDILKLAVAPEHEHWLKVPGLRASTPNDAYAADLIIIARGYEACGQKDMAAWLVDQVMAKYGTEERLSRLAGHRFADWHYQVAMDRWQAHADWKRLAMDLEELSAKAPEDWPCHAAIQDLRQRLAGMPQQWAEAHPVTQAMQRALYGPGRVSGWFPMGNWVLFPLSECSLAEKKGRFDDLLSLDASALLLWAEMLEDKSPCACSQTVIRTGGVSQVGELPRRPFWTSELAFKFVSAAMPGKIKQGDSLEAIREQCLKMSKLMAGKSSQEKFLASAEHGGWMERSEAIYGLYDVGFEGPWSGIESQIFKDCHSAKGFTSSLDLFVNLRKAEASSLVRQLEQAGAVTWNLGPKVMKRLKDGLAIEPFEEVLKKWAEHRGKSFSGDSRDLRPIYTTTPTRLLSACLNEAARTPAFFCDFIELAIRHRSTPNNPINLSWPGAQTSFAHCRQPLKEFLHDQTLFPLANRARGGGQLAENRGQMIAWMMLDATVEYRKALSFDGYAVLGVEWLDALVIACQKAMEGNSLPGIAGVKRFAESFQFVEPEQDVLVQALQWDAAHFREKWRSLPLSQRITLAQRPVVPVGDELKKLRSVVRSTHGENFVKPGDQFTDEVFDEMILWAGAELSKSKGVCGMVRWRSGLAGVDVETESFADSSSLALPVIDGLRQSYTSKPGARRLIIASARCGTSVNAWVFEAGSSEQANVPERIKQWLENLPESKLAQTSFWLVGIDKDLLK